MKLDVNILRYLSHDEWRTLTAVEVGQRNHELVPTTLVETIAKLKHGGAYKSLCTCLKHKLVHHENKAYDGYRLTNLGYDYLAINTLKQRGRLASIGRQIGVGKESDLFEVADEEGNVMALKLHRLGRTSFRAVKSKRDYLRKGNHYSWLYLSRLAAIKEYAFMKALGDRGLPVPIAHDQNRHAVLMSRVDGVTLVQVHHLDDPGPVYDKMMDVLCDITRLGLVHCDYNEFNVMLGPDGALTVIDFPQMVSISHANGQELFERDVQCVMRFFRKKLNYWMQDGDRPSWEELVSEATTDDAVDKELAASGFNNADAAALAGALERSKRVQAHDEDDASDDEASNASGSLSDDGSAESVSARDVRGAQSAQLDSGQDSGVLRDVDLGHWVGEHGPGHTEQRAGHARCHEDVVRGRSSDGACQAPDRLGVNDVSALQPGGEYGAIDDAAASACGDSGDAVRRNGLSAAETAHAHQQAQARIQQQRRRSATRAAKHKATRNATKAKGRNQKVFSAAWD